MLGMNCADVHGRELGADLSGRDGERTACTRDGGFAPGPTMPSRQPRGALIDRELPFRDPHGDGDSIQPTLHRSQARVKRLQDGHSFCTHGSTHPSFEPTRSPSESVGDPIERPPGPGPGLRLTRWIRSACSKKTTVAFRRHSTTCNVSPLGSVTSIPLFSPPQPGYPCGMSKPLDRRPASGPGLGRALLESGPDSDGRAGPGAGTAGTSPGRSRPHLRHLYHHLSRTPPGWRWRHPQHHHVADPDPIGAQ